MAFPPHIAAILDQYGVAAATKAALYDLYLSLGNEALESFIVISERIGSAAQVQPEDLAGIREEVVDRFLRRNHPRWLEGLPTPSLWHPRELEGRAAGLAVPLGRTDQEEKTPFVEDVVLSLESILTDEQPFPRGIVVMGKNAHFGGRSDTISFDVVASDLEDAIAISRGLGQQHTLPGSVGQTSGTLDSARAVALVWEIQPNIYKPSPERNQGLTRLYGRHRNWHVSTLVTALLWLSSRVGALYALRGSALAATHEVNPAKPISELVADLHDRTLERVTKALGYSLNEPTPDDDQMLLGSTVMNVALRQMVEASGARGAIWRLEQPHVH